MNCTQCGGSELRPHSVRSAFWQDDDRLVVVEGIPAMVCADCGERYFDDATAVGLDLMRGAGFPSDRARAELRVDVFSFDDIVVAEEPQ